MHLLAKVVKKQIIYELVLFDRKMLIEGLSSAAELFNEIKKASRLRDAKEKFLPILRSKIK